MAGWLVCSATVLAQAQNSDKRYGVRDEAGLFNKDTIKKADEELARIHDLYGRDVFIETLKDGPKDQKLYDWAVERARQHRFSGVYVVITVNPHKLEVLADKQTRSRGLFTAPNEKELANRMLERLREKKMDEALLQGMEYLRETFRKNSPAVKNENRN
jgi:hypothetical protein